MSRWRDAIEVAEPMREMSDIGVAALMRNRRDREIGTRQQDLCAGAPQVLKCDGGTQPEYLPKQPVQVAAGDVSGYG